MDQSRNIDNGLKIANRRFDDIVIIIRHDFFVETGKNEVIIEYLNNYGKKFFNLSNELIHNINNEKVYFESILDAKTQSILYDSLNEEAQDGFKTKNLADILRKISHFTVINSEFKKILVDLKVFNIYEKEEIRRKKNVQNFYYYIIMREIDTEMRIAEFRLNFFQKMNSNIAVDEITNIPDVKSTINELKMLMEFCKTENTNIIASIIEINNTDDDQILIASIAQKVRQEIRYDDFIGHFNQLQPINNKNQLLIILHNCTAENGQKALTRLYTSILSNQYLFDKYKDKRCDIISISYTKLKADDDFEKVESRLDQGLQNNTTSLEEMKISYVE